MRWLVFLFVAALGVLAWSHDGRAQEAGSTLTITLQAEGAGPEDNFVFSVAALGDGSTESVVATPGASVTLDVAAGLVSIVEAPPAGWAFDGASCTGPAPFVPVDVEPAPEGEINGTFVLQVPPGVDVDCVITHVPAPTGTLRFTKTVVGPNPDPLAEHLVFIGVAPGRPLRADETIEVEVNAGLSFVGEQPAEGFGTFIIDCGDAIARRFGAQVLVDVPVDGVADCAVINVANPVATLRIEKLTEQDSGEFRFPFRVGETDFDLAASFAAGFGGVEFALGPGPYEFVELPSDGWFLREVSCSGFGVELIDQGVRVTPEQGSDIDCSFTNELLDQTVGQPGDANCDGLVDIIDALVIAQLVAEVRSEVQQCPLGDAAVEVFGPAADVDDSGIIDIIDALVVARCAAGLPAPLCPEL